MTLRTKEVMKTFFLQSTITVVEGVNILERDFGMGRVEARDFLTDHPPGHIPEGAEWVRREGGGMECLYLMKKDNPKVYGIKRVADIPMRDEVKWAS